MRRLIFVGYFPNGERRIVRETFIPTHSDRGTSGAYALVGPFRTIKGALRCVAPHGPLLQTVADFERYARLGL
jgi:hypothetical protein